MHIAYCIQFNLAPIFSTLLNFNFVVAYYEKFVNQLYEVECRTYVLFLWKCMEWGTHTHSCRMWLQPQFKHFLRPALFRLKPFRCLHVSLPVNMYAVSAAAPLCGCVWVLVLVWLCLCIYKPYSSDMLPLAVVFAGNSQRDVWSYLFAVFVAVAA